MQCIVCGKESEETFCEKCKKTNGFEFNDFALKKCRKCGRFYLNNRWSDVSLKNAFSLALKKNTKERFGIEEVKIERNRAYAKVKCDQYYFIDVPIADTICDKCHKKGSKYYEGVLQIRNKQNKGYEGIINDVKEVIDNRGGFITKVIEQKNGVDFHLSSKKLIQIILNDLSNKYGGEVKFAPKLYSVSKSGKELYRLNGVIYLPKLQSGDIIKVHNNIFLIKKVQKDRIYGVDLITHSNKVIKYEEHDVLTTVDESYDAMVCRNEPSLEVLHPKNYQCVPVKNMKKSKKDTIKVVLVEDQLYAL